MTQEQLFYLYLLARLRVDTLMRLVMTRTELGNETRQAWREANDELHDLAGRLNLPTIDQDVKLGERLRAEGYHRLAEALKQLLVEAGEKVVET